METLVAKPRILAAPKPRAVAVPLLAMSTTALKVLAVGSRLSVGG